MVPVFEKNGPSSAKHSVRKICNPDPMRMSPVEWVTASIKSKIKSMHMVSHLHWCVSVCFVDASVFACNVVSASKSGLPGPLGDSQRSMVE